MATAKRAAVTHVIFDLDGLLLDTEPMYTKANAMAMEKYGKRYNLELKAQTMGMKHNAAVAHMLQYMGLSGTVSAAEYSSVYVPYLFSFLTEVKLLPGAMKVVRYFATNNIPMAICTGSNTEEFQAKVKNHQDLLDLIPLRVLTGDDPAVKRGKPAPDGFLVTMERFEKKPASPANVLVFEDAPNGVIAAVAAGMQVVMVPDLTYSSPPEIALDKIACVLKTLEDFEPQLFGLPSF